MDDKGRFIVSDQHGGLYRFPIPKLGEKVDPATIQQITYSTAGAKARKRITGTDPKPMTEELAKLPQIGHAQGLCYAFDSLYVVVNTRNSSSGCGVFRLLDTDGDDNFDKLIELKKLGLMAGEHGPHAIIPAPDGKHLYVVIGNQTKVPSDYTHSRVPEFWGEDQLLPSLQYSSKGAEAPLGHIAQIDPEGKEWEIIATGFRNHYDAAFNREGELFTYDADMELDLNTPWYRPTRINHVIDGADYGWRTGSGKFMDYCSDTFGAVVDIGPGSPTGVCFGYGAKFPAKYQNAFFACDWSYGKLYAVHLKPKGSTYSATFEVFASAQPLPLTDLLVNPADGAMYMTVGGRRVQSGLYRLTYTGSESTDPAVSVSGGEAARKGRRALEAYLQVGSAVANKPEHDYIWASLGSADRGIRHAARAALEKQPVSDWKGRLSGEKDPVISTAAMIALARVDADKSASEVFEKATSLSYEKTMFHQTRLDILRSVILALTRGGQPSSGDHAKLIKWLDKIYPAQTPEENRDLSAIAAFLKAPFAVERGIKLLTNASGQEEQIGYALNLRYLKVGWTPELRRTYFKWFVLSGNYKGGARLSNYLADIKKHATESVPAADLSLELKELIATQPKSSIPQFTFEARSFVQNWSMEDFSDDLDVSVKKQRDFSNGRKMAGAGTCYVCHRFNGEGGAIGPDLSSAGGKFSAYDLLEAIVDPGKEISDQYGTTNFNFKDGTLVSGRIVNLGEDHYQLNTDMMNPGHSIFVKIKDLESIEASPISMMPPGLINTMSKDDVYDLLAYFISGGDPEHSAFKK
jgi:putative heme-binding domain-containing protein